MMGDNQGRARRKGDIKERKKNEKEEGKEREKG